ncbi:MAG: carboxynorspermidine decarboxylase [Rikenellaceae bacterium]
MKEEILGACYVLEENKLRDNLKVISQVASKAQVEIIVALKASAMWSIFPIMREYLDSATASSLAEARLVKEEFGSLSHTYAPTYQEHEFDEILSCSSHITFNSLSQFARFSPRARAAGVSCGLRINPLFSPVETDLYNPCVPNSRLGVEPRFLSEIPEGMDGLHCHNLCESSAQDAKKTLEQIEKYFSHILPKIKWLNLGGGHLMTRKGYDTELLITSLREFNAKYPNLKIILEPGSAHTWQTGYLEASIEDIIPTGETMTAMLNVSFACHMPDCLEMPYKPQIRGAHEPQQGETRWRMGGCSCLAGDFCGDWSFENEPKVGDKIIFEDMIHYTMVKTTMFNGVAHPSIAIKDTKGEIKIVKKFDYEDFKGRMS